MQNRISIKINDKVYLKDPESSKLGIRIIQSSVDLLEEIGYEDFTFKKLALRIESTEASIYRYFESKHNLLVYLTMWYWGWLEYRLTLAIINVNDSKEQLKRALNILTQKVIEDETFSHINEVKLNRIIISESSKVYLCKNVQKDNEQGYFSSYKSVVEIVSGIVMKIQPDFKYPHMLISTVIEGAHHQRFFAEYLPRLTDELENDDAVSSFYLQLVEKALEIETKN